MMDHHVAAMAERVVLTPAERAVVVEQCETARLHLEAVIKAAEDGASYDVIKGFTKSLRPLEYVQNILNTKIGDVFHEEHEH